MTAKCYSNAISHTTQHYPSPCITTSPAVHRQYQPYHTRTVILSHSQGQNGFWGLAAVKSLIYTLSEPSPRFFWHPGFRIQTSGPARLQTSDLLHSSARTKNALALPGRTGKKHFLEAPPSVLILPMRFPIKSHDPVRSSRTEPSEKQNIPKKFLQSCNSLQSPNLFGILLVPIIDIMRTSQNRPPS